MGDAKPRLFCFVARTNARGGPDKVFRVDLESAQLLHERWGFAVIGPDPADEIELAKWEREQEASRRKWWP